jgi:hypothetical protein
MKWYIRSEDGFRVVKKKKKKREKKEVSAFSYCSSLLLDDNWVLASFCISPDVLLCPAQNCREMISSGCLSVFHS